MMEGFFIDNQEIPQSVNHGSDRNKKGSPEATL